MSTRSNSLPARGEMELTCTEGAHGPVGIGGIPNSASVSRLTANPTGGVAASPFRSEVFVLANGGGLVDDSLRFPSAAEDGSERGELAVEVGNLTPERGVCDREEAAPFIRVKAGGAVLPARQSKSTWK